MGMAVILHGREDLIDVLVVLEDVIILHEIKDYSHAVAMLMFLLYALNIDYLKELQYTLEIIQQVPMNISSEHCTARVHKTQEQTSS